MGGGAAGGAGGVHHSMAAGIRHHGEQYGRETADSIAAMVKMRGLITPEEREAAAALQAEIDEAGECLLTTGVAGIVAEIEDSIVWTARRRRVARGVWIGLILGAAGMLVIVELISFARCEEELFYCMTDETPFDKPVPR